MGELLGGTSRVEAVIGPGCNSACEVTSFLSGGQNVPQISYSCSSASLSDKTKYKLVRDARPLMLHVREHLIARSRFFLLAQHASELSCAAVFEDSGISIKQGPCIYSNHEALHVDKGDCIHQLWGVRGIRAPADKTITGTATFHLQYNQILVTIRQHFDNKARENSLAVQTIIGRSDERSQPSTIRRRQLQFCSIKRGQKIELQDCDCRGKW